MDANMKIEPQAYKALPLECMTIKDLTDALGIEKSAEVLATTRRAIYTVRNTKRLSVQRVLQLIEAVRADENACRQRLIVTRNRQV